VDEYAVAALCAVPPELQGSDAEKFFDLIVEMYADGSGPSSLDDLIPQIGERDSGLANPAAQFSENLRQQGLDGRWSAIAGMLASEGGSGSALASLRVQYAAEAAEAGGPAAGPAPTWEDFRRDNADFWSGWPGSDWAAWRGSFAERVPAGLRSEVDPHLAYLDTLDPASQLTYLRDTLGFAVNQQALDSLQPAGTSAAEPDEIAAIAESDDGQALATATEEYLAALRDLPEMQGLSPEEQISVAEKLLEEV
jgi:hypothetical protein